MAKDFVGYHEIVEELQVEGEEGLVEVAWKMEDRKLRREACSFRSDTCRRDIAHGEGAHTKISCAGRVPKQSNGDFRSLTHLLSGLLFGAGRRNAGI